MAPSPPERIGRVTRVLHWATAALVACGFGAALLFNILGPGPGASRLVEVHRSIGLCILALTVIRVLWRSAHPIPSLPSPRWERWLSGAVQVLLTMALLVMPALGWLGSNAQGDTVMFLGLVRLPDLVNADQDWGDRLFTVHAWLGTTIVALLALHVAGALRHHFIKKDDVLRRMVTGGGGRSAG